MSTKQPAPPVTVPNVVEGVAAVAVPVAARFVPSVVVTDSGTLVPDHTAMETERERALAALMTFKKFNLLTFDGEKIDPWVMETWFDSIKMLFEDLYTLKKEKVHLAAHYLEKSAKMWWKGFKRDQPSNLASVTLEEFQGLMFSNYVPDSEMKKLPDQFSKL